MSVIGPRWAVPANLDIPQMNGKAVDSASQSLLLWSQQRVLHKCLTPSRSWISPHFPRGRETSKHNKRQCPLWELHSSLARRHLVLSNTTSGGAAPHSNRIVVELMYGLLHVHSSGCWSFTLYGPVYQLYHIAVGVTTPSWVCWTM